VPLTPDDRDDLVRRLAAGGPRHTIELRLANLAGQRLNGLDFSKRDLSGASLREAKLTECDLSAANLSHADLRDAEFRACNLSRANLAGALAADAFFAQCDLTHARFEAADLRGARFEHSKARGLSLERAVAAGLTQADCEMFPRTAAVSAAPRTFLAAVVAAGLALAGALLTLFAFIHAAPSPPVAPAASPETAAALALGLLGDPRGPDDLRQSFGARRARLGRAVQGVAGLVFIGVRDQNGKLLDRVGTPPNIGSEAVARREALVAQALADGRPAGDATMGLWLTPVVDAGDKALLELGFAPRLPPTAGRSSAEIVAAVVGALFALLAAVFASSLVRRSAGAHEQRTAAVAAGVADAAYGEPSDGGAAASPAAAAAAIAARGARRRFELLTEMQTAAATENPSDEAASRLEGEVARLQDLLDKRSAVLSATNAKLADRSRELKSKNEALERIARKKDEFFSVVTHDLRSPLTVMRGVASMFREGVLGELTPDQLQMVETLNLSIDNQLGLINDLLDSAKLEDGRIQLTLASFDLGGLAREIGRTMSLLAQDKSIALEVEAAPNLPPANADRDKIKRVIANLVSNAVKFTEPGGGVVVSVKASADGAALVCSVLDTGVGIPAEDLPKLFDKFYQAQSRSTRREKGTGLGLFICKQIVEAHGGEVRVASTVGEGSAFSFTLPLEQRPAR
jgi:signal transduction histidine kinase